jgi:hypothetical protein
MHDCRRCANFLNCISNKLILTFERRINALYHSVRCEARGAGSFISLFLRRFRICSALYWALKKDESRMKEYHCLIVHHYLNKLYP